MAARFKTLYAKPTLQGLRITSKKSTRLTGTIVPWTALMPPPPISDRKIILATDQNMAIWTTHDEEGNPLVEDDRPLLLFVTGWQANYTAQRAHQRAVERAWKRGAYNFSLKNDQHRTAAIGTRVAAVTLAAVSLAWIIWGIPWLVSYFDRTFVNVDSQYRSLVTAMPVLIIAAVSGHLLIVFVIIREVMATQKANVAEILCDKGGIQARLHDRGEVEYSWNDLTEIRRPGLQRAIIAFHDGTRLQLRTDTKQARLLVRLAERIYYPQSAAIRKRKDRMFALRFAISFVAGTIMCSWIVYAVDPRCSDAWTLVLFTLPMLACFVAAMLLAPPLVERAIRRIRRRRRRRLAHGHQ